MNKTCGVCGQKSKAVSCESCKAFFRRWVTINKTPRCNFDNKCQINQNNRHCKKCRMDRCLAIGMKKELIKELIDKPEQKDIGNLVNKRINSKRCNGLAIPSDGNSCSDSDRNSMSDSMTNTSEELNTEELLASSFEDYNSGVEPWELTDDELSEGIRQMEEFLMESDARPEVSKTETTTSLVTITKPIATYDKPLNDIELNRLNEVSLASNQFTGHYNTANIKTCVEFTDVNDMYEKMSKLNVYDIAVMDSIKFCKGISLFKEVCEDDRLTLFKHNCRRIITLRYIASYQRDKTFTIVISKEFYIRLPITLLKNPNENLYRMVSEFYDNVPPELIREPVLISLLMAFILFDSNAPNLKYKQIIKLNQQMYLYLLQRYLLLKYRSQEISLEMLSNLMRILIEIQMVCEEDMKTIGPHLQVLTPLVREVMGL